MLWLFACLVFVSACGSTATQAANPARINASVAAVSFGQQQVGTTSSPVLIRLTCSGSKQINITSFDINGPFGHSSPSPPAKLACGSVLDLYVTFSPSSVGSVGPNYLTISSNAGNSPVSIALTGEGTGETESPSLSVVPASLSFGSQTVGTTSAPQTVTLSNTGTTSVTLSSATVTGPFALSGWPGSTTLPAGQSLALQVAFSPTTEGSFTGALTVSSSAPSSPHTVSLSGTGTSSSSPLAWVSPTSISFGTQTVATTSAAQAVTVANNGTADLVVSGISLSSSAFAVSGPAAPVTIAPSQSVSYSVTFTPSAAESYSGQLSFTSNSASSPHTVSLSGTGASETTALSVLPTSLSFGSQTVNTTSPALPVTVSNVGTGSVTISGVSITGPFAVSGWSGSTTLLSGQSLALQVTFKPLSEGSFTGTLTITSNAPSSPDKVALSGTGASSAGGLLCGLVDQTDVLLPLTYDADLRPAMGASLTDPVFGCSLRRVSDGAAQFGKAVHHEYAPISPFNADGRFVLLLLEDGRFFVADLTGNVVVSPDTLVGVKEPRWSPTDPNTFYYHAGNELRRFNMLSRSSALVRKFSEYTSIDFAGGESDISDDGNHLLIRGGGQLFVYTISADRKGRAIAAPSGFDNGYMTPRNNVLIHAGGGNDLYDSELNFIRRVTPYVYHKDVGLDLDDEEVVVFVGSNDPSPAPGCGGNGIEKIRLRDGAKSCLLPLYWGESTHISVKNGWALISNTDVGNFSGGTAASPPCLSCLTNWTSFGKTHLNEITMVKLDGSQVVRLAHHRSRRWNTYWYTPRASLSPDAGWVAFDSNFGQNPVSNYTDVYVIKVK